MQVGVKHYFTNSNGYLRGIRIDTTQILGDTTVFYPFRTPRGSYNSMTGISTVQYWGSSWLGGKVLQLSSGTFIFDNLWGNSVTIKTQALVGEEWFFYRDSSSLYYRASVIAIDTLTFLGILDSVKILQINALDSMGLYQRILLMALKLYLVKIMVLYKYLIYIRFLIMQLTLIIQWGKIFI